MSQERIEASADETTSGAAETSRCSTVVDGTIYVAGHEGSLRLHAVDAETGAKQWHFEVETAIMTTPAVQDGTVYITSSPHLIAVDAESGEEKWRYNTKTVGLTGAPTVDGDTVYVGSNGFHHALDTETGEEIWTAETGASGALASQAVADGTVYASSEEGLFALDAETGEKQWGDKWNQIGGAGPPTVVSGTVYFIEDSGGGIPEDERGNVFEHGYTTDRDGHGYGLSVVRAIVEAHGWTIHVTDGTDGGARFEISGVESD